MKGMLWLMTDIKRPFAERVLAAVAYYAQKYGRRPVLVQVNKADMDNTAVDGITVEIGAYVPLHHLFVVVEK